MRTDHVDTLLAQWATERPELDTSGLAVTARIVRLERFIGRAGSSIVTRFGLNEGELNVLAALRRAGAPNALTPTDLYKGLLLSSGAMTNRIDRLEDRGLVERVRDDDDRRRILVVLTDEGRELIDAAMDAHVDLLVGTFDVLDDDERDTLVSLLRKVLLPIEEADAD